MPDLAAADHSVASSGSRAPETTQNATADQAAPTSAGAAPGPEPPAGASKPDSAGSETDKASSVAPSSVGTEAAKDADSSQPR